MSALIESLQQDVRFAVRHFRRTPASTTTLIAVLAIGIGVNAALFALVHALTMQPAPGIVRDASLVRVRALVTRDDGSRRGRAVSRDELASYVASAGIFTQVAAWAGDEALIDAGTGPQAAPVEFVTPNYFEMLGVRSFAGELLPRATDGAVALIGVASYGYWSRVLRGTAGGNGGATGQVVRVNGVPVTVLGVVPPPFVGVDPRGSLSGQVPVLWLPVSALEAISPRRGTPRPADDEVFSVIGRLRDGTSITAAAAAATLIASRFPVDRTTQSERTRRSATVVPLRASNGDPVLESRINVFAASLAAATMLVLLVACTNVSILLLSRAVARRREIGVRLALGASRVRVVRQLLVESVILACSGSALGLTILGVAIRLVGARIPGVEVHVQWQAVAFAALLALLAAMAFGLAPALHGTRVGAGEVLKSAGTGPSIARARLQRAFVVAQIALSQPLLVGLGALVWFATTGVVRQDRSRVREQILSVSVDTYSGTANRWNATVIRDALMERIAGLPGVRRVASHELEFSASAEDLVAADRPSTRGVPLAARVLRVGPGYFDAMGMAIVRGREFDGTDVSGAPNAIVIAREVATQLWGDADPIGRRLVSTGRHATEFVVTGVVDAPAASRTETQGRVLVYAAEAQGSEVFIPRLLVRTTGAAQAVMPSVRSLVRAIDADLPEPRLATLAELDARQRRELTQLASASSAGGVLVLILASVGLFSVVALSVGVRTREIAVRVALGAESVQVSRLFFRSGVKLSAIGIAIGLPASIGALQALPTDAGMVRLNTPLVAALTAVVVVGVTTLATWLPSRRAARVSPLDGLRAEG